MVVIDNYLKESDHDQLFSAVFSTEFPWYYTDHKVFKEQESSGSLDLSSDFQFVHTAFNTKDINSPLFFKLQELFGEEKNFVGKEVIRIKLNLITKTEGIKKSAYHTDIAIDEPYTTAIYYVNTNDGYTGFEDGTQISSVANRLVIFDGNKKHFGTTCTDKNARVVINFNFLGEFKL